MLELLNAESMVKSIAAEFEIGTRENRKDQKNQERPEKSGKTRKKWPMSLNSKKSKVNCNQN